MPAANQFTWTHKELITLMVKAMGIHEGRWMLLMSYGMSPGNFGPSDDQISPGMIVTVTGIGIQREAPGAAAPSSLVVDAAEVNPASQTTATSSIASAPPPSQSQPASVEPSSPPRLPAPRAENGGRRFSHVWRFFRFLAGRDPHDLVAAPITSAGRFSPRGPLGIAKLLFEPCDSALVSGYLVPERLDLSLGDIDLSAAKLALA
jgi:hypothetical protein